MDGRGKWRTCGRLFFEMFAIALFVLGGGFAILAVADDRFSRKLKWLREGELLSELPVFQMIPGIVAGHTAVYVGHRVAGFAGAACALLGTVLPSVLVFTSVTICYERIPLGNPHLVAAFVGLRASLTGILAVMAVRSGRTCLYGPFAWCLFGAALVLLMGFRLPPGFVIAGAVAIGVWQVRRTDAKSPPVGGVFRSFWAIPLVFLGYGLIAFGGGYVLVPAYLHDFVGATARYLQLSGDEFANVMALSQMTPGPIGVNCATYFGYRMGGLAGAFVATFALVLPGSVVLLVALRSLDRFRASVFVRGLFAGVRPVALALLVAATSAFAGLSAWQMQGGCVRIDPVGVLLVLLASLAFGLRKLGAVATILISAALAILLHLL